MRQLRLQSEPCKALRVEERLVDGIRIRARMDELCRRLVGVGGGIGILEAAGVGRDGKIECVRQLLRERYAEKLQEL